MSNTITPPSITRELLALPEVNFAGISSSIVVRHLSVHTQQQIRHANTDEEKLAIAAVAGDQHETIQEIYHDLVAGPAARRAAGVKFPTFESVDHTFLAVRATD